MAGLHFSSGIDKGFENDLNRMNKQMNSFGNNVNKQGNSIEKTFGGIKDTIVQLAAVGGFVELTKELTNLTNETYKYRNEITKLTGLQGHDLNNFTANITASAGTFGKEVDEMSLAVSNFAKGMNIDLNQSLDLVNQGFLQGADANGEFLDTIKEYGPQFKSAGLSAQQAINVISTSVKEGVFSDKGADTIKEATLRIREMPKATSDAINGIGLSSTEIQKALADGSKTIFDVIQDVSKQMATLPPQSANA